MKYIWILFSLTYFIQLAKYQDEDKIAIFNLNFNKDYCSQNRTYSIETHFHWFQNGNKTTQKLDEAGLIAEYMLFKARTDWM